MPSLVGSEMCIRDRGPFASDLARSRRGSRYPASSGPIPAGTLPGSRAAAEQSDPELRSFRWILRDGKTHKIFHFFSVCFAPGEIIVSSCCCCCCFSCCDHAFDVSLRISLWSRGPPLSLDNLPARVAFDVFDPLCLACFGIRLLGEATPNCARFARS